MHRREFRRVPPRRLTPRRNAIGRLSRARRTACTTHRRCARTIDPLTPPTEPVIRPIPGRLLPLAARFAGRRHGRFRARLHRHLARRRQRRACATRMESGWECWALVWVWGSVSAPGSDRRHRLGNALRPSGTATAPPTRYPNQRQGRAKSHACARTHITTPQTLPESASPPLAPDQTRASIVVPATKRVKDLEDSAQRVSVLTEPRLPDPRPGLSLARCATSSCS